MVFVKLKKAPSEIQGFGCFAGEKISRGTVIAYWADPEECWILSAEAHRKKFKKKSVRTLKTAVRLMGDLYVQAHPWDVKDPTDFMNHSDKPNVGYAGGLMFALKDIARGVEMLMDYRLLNAHYEVDVVRGHSAKKQLKASAKQVRRAFKAQ
ncbi:SET domain-containing protein [bacterium]|nr:SET domain-containing protein [bacterium]